MNNDFETQYRARQAEVGRRGGQAKSDRKLASLRAMTRRRQAGELSQTPAAIAARNRRQAKREEKDKVEKL